MRRREYVRGAGALVVGGLVGSAVATEVFAGRGATVEQVVEGGVPQPRSILTVWTTGRVDAVDAGRVHLSVPVVDPTTGRRARRAVDVVEATSVDSRLRLVVDGPVSRGTVVSFDERGLSIDGRRTSAFSYVLEGSLVPVEQATQWFKAYEPTNVDHFGPRVYRGGKPSRQITHDDDPAAVRDRLAAHLDRFVARGRLDAGGRDAALARFDDPAVRARFVDREGAFDAEVLAGVLANAGTVARGIDAVLIDGENRFGRPYAIRRQPTPSGGLMEVRVDGGEPVVVVDPRLDGEPFAVLAPLLAHEGFHQDLSVGIDEEVIATYLETLVWAEHVLADPSLARLDTSKVRRANTMLLVALNSGGRSFPEVGLHAAPHRQGLVNATPGATEPVSDFVSAVTSRYRRTPPGSSPGVPYARTVIGRVVGTAPAGLDFDGETLDLLDERTRLFSPEDVLRLLTALELRPTGEVTGDGEPAADPVAIADASRTDAEFTTATGGASADPGPQHAACGTCLRGAADPN